MREIIEKIVSGEVLTQNECYGIFNLLMDGKLTSSQMAGFLIALKARGEDPIEIATCAKVLLEKAHRIYPNVDVLVDTCGTGGDAQATLNFSTISALVVAGAGVAVAKHGNRSVSSTCGSADLLEAFGLKIDLEPKKVKESIEKYNFGFLFAPSFHPAMRHAASVRKELGVRTIFNILGPLVNPAGVKRQMIGVYSKELAKKVAYALQYLGCEKAYVVHGLEGLDEVSPCGETLVIEVNEGKISSFILTPDHFGYPAVSLDKVKVKGKEEAVERAYKILSGYEDPATYAVLMNSALALMASGKYAHIKEAKDAAENSLFSAKALKVLNESISFSQS